MNINSPIKAQSANDLIKCYIALLLLLPFTVIALEQNSDVSSKEIVTYIDDYSSIYAIDSGDEYDPNDDGADLSHDKPEFSAQFITPSLLQTQVNNLVTRHYFSPLSRAPPKAFI